MQLDVVATQPKVDNTNEVILAGETKARNTPMGTTELNCLDNIIDRQAAEPPPTPNASSSPDQASPPN